uniref:Uncharacterized protein n=1 Tax=Homalodisca liturata TaxID=320908 RepID=A0A1B6IA93_9HEMI
MYSMLLVYTAMCMGAAFLSCLGSPSKPRPDDEDDILPDEEILKAKTKAMDSLLNATLPPSRASDEEKKKYMISTDDNRSLIQVNPLNRKISYNNFNVSVKSIYQTVLLEPLIAKVKKEEWTEVFPGQPDALNNAAARMKTWSYNLLTKCFLNELQYSDIVLVMSMAFTHPELVSTLGGSKYKENKVSPDNSKVKGLQSFVGILNRFVPADPNPLTPPARSASPSTRDVLVSRLLDLDMKTYLDHVSVLDPNSRRFSIMKLLQACYPGVFNNNFTFDEGSCIATISPNNGLKLSVYKNLLKLLEMCHQVNSLVLDRFFSQDASASTAFV